MARIVTIGSLSGGQGKSTVALMLSRYLARLGVGTILIDTDPQANTTQYSGINVPIESTTLLNILNPQERSSAAGAMLDVESNLWLIPANKYSIGVPEILSSSGNATSYFRRHIRPLTDYAEIIIIDTPPALSQLTLAAYSSADMLLIPVEANDKGCTSLKMTLATVDELRLNEIFTGVVEGIIPFRTKIIGSNMTNISKTALNKFSEYGLRVFPSIVESESYKNALIRSGLPSQYGGTDATIEAISRVVTDVDK